MNDFNVEAVLQAPELTFFGAASAAIVPKLDHVDLRVGIDAAKGLLASDAAALQQAANLDQNGILHLNRLVEGPEIAEYAACAARQQDHRGQTDEKAGAQRRCHDGRSTIHPTPRTFRIAVAPSFFLIMWIRNSMALLSTSSFQP